MSTVTQLIPFELRVQALVKSMGDAWRSFQLLSAPAAPCDLVLARINQLQPRTLEEGMAARELGWAWADGAGFSEWEAAFLRQLQREGRLAQFLAFLVHLRSSCAGSNTCASAHEVTQRAPADVAC